jgi:peptidoglycan hydrolase-like protein with peptidoglycan-binding domain
MNSTITKKLTGALTGLLVAATIFGFVALPSAQALTSGQVDSIISLLQSFGVDAATIAQVEGTLTGNPVTVTPPAQGGSSCDTYGTSAIVRVGSRGSNVEAIQMAMNQILDLSGNNSMAPLAVDGIFGPLTKGVVQYFQGIIGTPADGVWGPNTQAAYLAYVANNCGNGGTTPVNPVNGWSVSGSSAGGNLVTDASGGQSAAHLLDLNFTGNGNVTSVKLQRKGVSSNNSVSNVYLFDGAVRITDAASVNNNGEVVFSMPQGLFSVNGAKTISVRADVSSSATAGQSIGFDLVEAMSGSAAIAGSAAGGLYTITSVSDLTQVSFGTVTPSGATLQPGAGVTVWQSTATVSDHDAYLDRIAFRQIGSAQASAFANFKLFVNGSEVAQASGLDANGYVTFVPASPVLVQTGSRVIRVDADIVSGSSRTVHFSMRNKSDASFRDSQYGVNGNISSAPVSPSSASTISGSNGGSLTIEKDVSSPSQNVIVNGTDISLGKFKVQAFGEPIKIETLTAAMTSSDNTVGSLRNGRIIIGGAQYGSQATLEDIAAGGTSYTLNYTVNPGSPIMIEVRADVYDNDGTNNLGSSDTITAQILAGSSNAQRIDSLGTLNAPSAAVSGNALTVAAASVTLAENTTYADQTTALPQTAYKLGSWNLSGSSVEDVNITQFSLDIDEVSGSTLNEDDLTNVYVKYGSQMTSPLATVSAADNTWSLNYTLPMNQSVAIELYGTIASGATSGHSFKTDLTISGTALESGQTITGTIADVDGQTIAYGAASLTATQDSSTPVAGIVQDNQTVTAAAFKFDAVNSGYTVSDLTISLSGADASAVSAINLYDGATLVATRPGAVTTSFSGLDNVANPFVIAANTNKVLTVKLDLASVGYQAGTSGADLQVMLSAGTATPTTGGSESITESNPEGNAMYVYAAVPKFESVALADQTLLNTAARPLMRFKVTAMGGPIAWYQFHFDGTKDSGTTVSSPTLWDVTDGANNQVTGTATVAGMGTSASTSGTVDFNASSEQQVSSYKVYELRGTIAGAAASGDFVTMTLANDSTSVVSLGTSTEIEDADTDAPVIWSDMSAQSHALSTSDWTSDYGVKNLPISSSLNWPN